MVNQVQTTVYPIDSVPIGIMYAPLLLRIAASNGAVNFANNELVWLHVLAACLVDLILITRFKNVVLSYSLPKSFVQKLKFTEFKLTVTATNLWTLTNYLGLDPEVGISDDPKKTGQDSNQTPVSR